MSTEDESIKKMWKIGNGTFSINKNLKKEILSYATA